MRKCWLAALLMVWLGLAGQALAADAEIRIYLDGQFVQTPVQPEIVNGVTFVPLRVVSEELGADVQWFDNKVIITNYKFNPVVRQQTFSNGAVAVWTEASIKLVPGKKTAVIGYNGDINGVLPVSELCDDKDTIELLAAPYLKNGNVMVPLRFISEQMGSKVSYADGRIDISPALNLQLDGKPVFSLRISNNFKDEQTTQRNIVTMCVKLIEEARGEEISQPENVSTLGYQGYLYQFRNFDDEVVAAWQFYVPAAEVAEGYGWSALYLYDSLNDKWYTADSAVYEKYFYEDILEPALNSLNVKLP